MPSVRAVAIIEAEDFMSMIAEIKKYSATKEPKTFQYLEPKSLHIRFPVYN
jgi:hypothetical protein